MSEYEKFETWASVIAHVTRDLPIYYWPPHNSAPVRVRAALRGSMLVRVHPLAGSYADPFTADADHLSRFRFLRADIPVHVGEDLTGLYAGLRVHLAPMGDYPHGDYVLATVSHHGAAEWAKDDQSIAGSCWETDGDDFAYAMICNMGGDILKQLKDYPLDLAQFSPLEKSCEKCGCHADNCGWKAA